MRSMGDPNYQYQPLSKHIRKQRSLAARARMGIPPGFRRVYGVHVPERFAPALKALVIKRINNGTSKWQGPLRCVPIDLAEEFALEVFKLLVTKSDTGDEALLRVAKDVLNRHGRRFTIRGTKKK